MTLIASQRLSKELQKTMESGSSQSEEEADVESTELPELEIDPASLPKLPPIMSLKPKIKKFPPKKKKLIPSTPKTPKKRKFKKFKPRLLYFYLI